MGLCFSGPVAFTNSFKKIGSLAPKMTEKIDCEKKELQEKLRFEIMTTFEHPEK